MIYELWDMISYGHGEPLVPFTLLEKSDKYENVYIEFVKIIKTKPCVIFLKEEQKTND